MSYRDFHYRWEFDLESSPEQLWPLVADTNRFNRDTGVPAIEMVQIEGLRNARRRLRLTTFGIPVEWEEQPFEWTRPTRFGVTRRYSKGPITELRVLVELASCQLPVGARNSHQPSGTKLTYQVWATPRNLIGLIAIPIQIGLVSARAFARTLSKYDRRAKEGRAEVGLSKSVEFVSGGRARLLALSETMVARGTDAELVGLIVDYIENADQFSLSRIRPYLLADRWQRPRRPVLEACLCATRAGIFDLQWNLICPLCRGGPGTDSLKDIDSSVHCEGCNIDFTANFEQSVELTFRPNPSIRIIDVETFCIGGPQVMPHVAAQQLLAPHSTRKVELTLDAGRYRLRTMAIAGWQHLRATEHGVPDATLKATNDGWPNEEIQIATEADLNFENATDEEQLFIFERTAWSDEAATAAEVTALQVFRDLFASEALRPGEQISVGTLTVLFTDLKDSTRMYREIGDATAFGRVMNHFDILKQVIAGEDGALVKTIGDAVMAVFRSPAGAVRAMLHAQQQFSSTIEGGRPLTLKAGLHTGPCIAVTLNERLDYFGSTVNMAARLEGQSTGNDVVISSSVYADPEVRELLSDPVNGVSATRFEISLKGFDQEKFELWRVGRAKSNSAP
jgi:adenylate cyclase